MTDWNGAIGGHTWHIDASNTKSNNIHIEPFPLCAHDYMRCGAVSDMLAYRGFRMTDLNHGAQQPYD